MAAVYPFNKDLQSVAVPMTKGNFGLWFNKFIPIRDFASCKPSDDKASDEKDKKDLTVEYYANKYATFSRENLLKKLLESRHSDQDSFCRTMGVQFETIVIKAKLKSHLITGIGESHPHEVSMVFDHNLGVPYVPASGIKGIVRFAHTIDLIDKIPEGELIIRDKDGKPCQPHFDDEQPWTNIPALFGTQKNRGAVIFLDAYPEKVPELHVDIMNPHYADYYGDDTNRIPPADYFNPVPIKFLTIAKDTVFVFRALVERKAAGLLDKVKTAFTRALTVEGVGAKTTVGYGIFHIEQKEPQISGSASDLPKQPSESFKNSPAPETWENVTLVFEAGSGFIKTRWQGKNGSTKDQSNISVPVMEKLKKKKQATARKVKAELIGGKEYRIIEILE